MTTNDDIPKTIWFHAKWVSDGTNVVGGILNWNTLPKDEGKKATLTITCTDGQYAISQSFAMEIEKKNKTEDGAASDSIN
jgi:hypothetical protein